MRKIVILATYWVVVCTSQLAAETFLVFGGKTGWMGRLLMKMIEEEGHVSINAKSRLENRESIVDEIDNIKPDFIINAAGITGRPHIDWCEDHKVETLRTNVIGTLNLIDVATEKGIHITHLGTGCLYDYDHDHPKYSGKGFTEDDEPNHFSSFYCYSKAYLEKYFMHYPTLLHLRVRMPLTFDWHPRNFIVKITNYKYVINEPNSLSVLEDLLPVAIDMTLKQIKGTYNLVNPGVISHNEILELYKQIVDPTFSWKNFSIEEQDRILKASRSNCELDCSKLLKLYPDIPHIRTSVIKALYKMKELKNS